MDHEYIDENNLVDLYLMGRLGPGDRAQFEMHFINCEKCVEELEETRALREALEIAWPEDQPRLLPVHSGPLAFLAKLNRSWQSAVIALVALLVALPAVLLFRESRQMRRELEQVRAAEPPSQQEQKLEARSVERDPQPYPNSRTRHRPAQVNTPIFALSAVRDASSKSRNDIALDHQQSLFMLLLELEGELEYKTYRATILKPNGRVVWRRGNLRPNQYNALAMLFRSDFFSPGDYLLRLEGKSETGPITIANYPFRVIRKKA